jgi:hypothetical protein
VNLRMVIPIEIAVVALLGAVFFGVHAVKDTGAKPKPDASRTPTATPSPTPKVSSKRLTNKPGKFSVGVPEDVKARQVGTTVVMTAADGSLSALIGPVEGGKIAKSSSAFVQGMTDRYTSVQVTGSDMRKVNGHRAKATYGQAVNEAKVQIRFVNVVIKATPHNYTINVFTAATSDPLFVAPRVNAIIDTFKITG